MACFSTLRLQDTAMDADAGPEAPHLWTAYFADCSDADPYSGYCHSMEDAVEAIREFAYHSHASFVLRKTDGDLRANAISTGRCGACFAERNLTVYPHVDSGYCKMTFIDHSYFQVCNCHWLSDCRRIARPMSFLFLPHGPKADGVLSLPASVRRSVCPSVRMTMLVRAITWKIFFNIFLNLAETFFMRISRTSSMMGIAAHWICA